jgi:phospholipid transport system substrate-binding protein
VGSQEIEILYTKESIDKEGYALVRTEIVNKRDLNFEIEYRLSTNKGNWEAYDIVIEGVSLVNNYRTQFNKIIRQESYEALVKKLKLKSAQVESTTASRK